MMDTTFNKTTQSNVAMQNKPIHTFRILLYFIVLFNLFMTVGLPLLIHYLGEMWKFENVLDRSAEMAFFWLGIGCLLWASVYLLYYRIFISGDKRKKKFLENLADEAKKVNGKIVAYHAVGTSESGELVSLNVEFTNFAGSLVQSTISFLDSQPEKNRYTLGADIPLLLLDKNGKAIIEVEAKGVVWNKGLRTMHYLVFLFLLVFAPILLYYSHEIENQGAGWRYLSFSHPFVLIPFILLIELIIIRIFTLKDIFSPKNNLLLLYGKTANAVIIHRNETGMTVNDRPEIKITVQYETYEGKSHTASFSRLISILDVHKVDVGVTIPILYDPKNPTTIYIPKLNE
ncbi:hypothetical protein [Sphingobacterium hungaricum]|uniref:Uncharacterized protein n=1 Tax=Sphingobacterium hungaricum TaxID=2082723 RepID=A0A928YQN4_9SPHI|nr:hypothetical protein [Sphingobacterium hungaricum]MBE8714149.1 hypothetical protein [Sphingobacterium hungaricum]